MYDFRRVHIEHGALKSKSESDLTDLVKSSKDLTDQSAKLELVQEFFQKIVASKTVKTKAFIEDIVNNGLGYIFGVNQVTVSIQSSVKNNKTVYSVVINDHVNNISGGKESHGGGVLSVVSFLFKFVISYLRKHTNLMVMDESFAFVSVEYQERLATFLSTLCKQFGYSMLVVSHSEELNRGADNFYRLEKINGETKIIGRKYEK